jgi:hypothetical protein
MTEADEDPYDAWNATPGPADPELTRNLVVAARSERPSAALEEVATTAYAAGVTPVAMMRACDAALDLVLADVPDGTYLLADDSMRDLMDRLVGWCPPGAHIEPLPPK